MAQDRSIRFSVDSTGARRGSREVTRSLDDIRRAAGRTDRAVEGVDNQFASLRRASAMLTGALGVLGVAAGGLTFAAGIRATLEWERALTNLAKTVDAPQERLDELADSFVRLSEEIPVAAGELANLGASAGQLGIATENIEGFVEVMAALGVSSNLSADEAATSFARFANIMQMPQDRFEQLGSVVVDLGNNLATTEKEIVEFGTRMAGAGAIAGLSEASVMAIGAAMSSVGVEAEAGGTAVQKVLIDINTAVAQGGDSLALFAKVAGMSAQEFATVWEDDAGAAFTSFVEGLGRQGDNATTVLEALGLTDQRLTRAFLSLGGAGDLLRRSIEMGNEAWEENVALADEAGRFYDTLGGDIQRLKNQFTNLAAAAGDDATPALRAAVQATSDLLTVSGDLAKAGLAGALLGGTVAAGKFTAAQLASAQASRQLAVQSSFTAQTEAAAAATVTAAKEAQTLATLKNLEATRASIQVARQAALAQLQSAQAMQAQAASVPIGQLSPLGGAAVQRELALRAAATRQVSAATRELAILGTQESRVAAQLTATTTALTGAQSANAKATTAASAAAASHTATLGRMTIAGRAATMASTGFAAALGFLASPLGIAVTSAGLLAALFVRMGNDAREAAKEAEDAAEAVDRFSTALDNLDGKTVAIRRAYALGQQRQLEARLAQVQAAQQSLAEIEAAGTSNLSGSGMTVTSVSYTDEQEASMQRLREFINENPVDELNKSLREARQTARSLENARDGIETGIVDPIVTGTEKLTDFQEALAAINAELRTMAMNERLGVFAPEFGVSAGEIAHGMPTRPRGGQVSETLVQNAGVQQGRIDAARIRELLRAAEEGGDSLARTASDVSRGVIDVADAFGGLDDGARRALSGITGLVGALDSFDKSKGLSLANIGSIMGAVGAFAQIAAGLTGTSEETKRHRQVLKENTTALDRLARSFDGFGTRGDLVSGISLIDRIQDLQFGGNAGAAGDLYETNQERLNALAAEYGITLDGSMQSLQDLEDALRMATDRLFEFGGSLSQQQAAQSAWLQLNDLDGDNNAVLNSQYGLLNQFAPELMDEYGLSNLNLESEAGRSVLNDTINQIFDDYVSGTLDRDLLNQFASGQEFIDALLGTDSALDAFAEGLNDATNAVTDIPKAINLALYEQRYASGLPATPPDGPATGDPGGGDGPSDAPWEQPDWRAPYDDPDTRDRRRRRNPYEQDGTMSISFSVGTIVNEAGDSAEDLARKLAEGAQIIYSQGGSLYMPGVVTEV